MSLEHAPQRNGGESAADSDHDLDYWHALIDEKAAATFIGVTVRTLQAWRTRGGGPAYMVIGPKMIRYTRFKLRADAEAQMRKSTSDPGAYLAPR